MSSETDEMKGRAKEAAGVLTDDEELQREGQYDQAAGDVKHKVDDAADWVKDKIDDVKDKVDRN